MEREYVFEDSKMYILPVKEKRREGGRDGRRERERETVYGAAFSPTRSGEGELQGSAQRPTS